MNESLIYGIRPVIEAIEAGKQIDKIYVKRGSDAPLIRQLRDVAKQHRVQVQEVPVEKLNRLTKNANHQGAVAVAAAIEYADIAEVVDAVERRGEVPLIVVFDGVTDVRNFGGIARSAECAGVHALIVPIKNSAPVNADAIKSSAGALNLIPVCRVGSIRNTLRYLQERGIQIAAASEKGDKMLYQANLKKPTALVMGSEDTGISREILKMCDTTLAIPLVGSIESLNVGAAAAVLLFEAVRQRMK
ncbi:MAG: 23S rRNA (guanosine(2251)-2'-O)-methyltransferase RlmB [Rikenellaceae bacterium]|jgi:23S rRNA (guanosine2251-2'-O)-methyltransferase|nr:23S rRNA (guanosine(2251)-2'-O)-methyltransferase RlmB [Rikenellaceae bacterium]